MRFPRIFFVLIAPVFAAGSLRADERPALPLERAIAIAADYLKESGNEKDHWIASIKLERESMTSRKSHWSVAWAPAVSLDGRKELGLDIAMDGSVARVVDKKAAK